VFKRHGYSVDLVSTSEATVTVSLDPQVPAHYDERRMAAFLADLEDLCRVTVHDGCVSISLVGNAIRTILGRLSAALDVFQDRHVHMVTQSANDLNLTLVVDPEHAILDLVPGGAQSHVRSAEPEQRHDERQRDDEAAPPHPSARARRLRDRDPHLFSDE